MSKDITQVKKCKFIFRVFKKGPLHILNEGVSEWEIIPTFKRITVEKEVEINVFNTPALLANEINQAHKTALKIINKKFKKCRPLFQKVILSEEAIVS